MGPENRTDFSSISESWVREWLPIFYEAILFLHPLLLLGNYLVFHILYALQQLRVLSSKTASTSSMNFIYIFWGFFVVSTVQVLLSHDLDEWTSVCCFCGRLMSQFR